MATPLWTAALHTRRSVDGSPAWKPHATLALETSSSIASSSPSRHTPKDSPRSLLRSIDTTGRERTRNRPGGHPAGAERPPGQFASGRSAGRDVGEVAELAVVVDDVAGRGERPEGRRIGDGVHLDLTTLLQVGVLEAVGLLLDAVVDERHVGVDEAGGQGDVAPVEATLVRRRLLQDLDHVPGEHPARGVRRLLFVEALLLQHLLELLDERVIC